MQNCPISFYFRHKGNNTLWFSPFPKEKAHLQSLPAANLVYLWSVSEEWLSRALTGCLNPDLVTELPAAIFCHFICHPQLQMQRSRHASDKTHHKHSEKAITLIWPTKERENAHIPWICRHPGTAPRSCTAVLHTWKKQVQLPNISFSFSFCTALFRFL